jgi:hypothetical protein
MYSGPARSWFSASSNATYNGVEATYCWASMAPEIDDCAGCILSYLHVLSLRLNQTAIMPDAASFVSSAFQSISGMGAD